MKLFYDYNFAARLLRGRPLSTSSSFLRHHLPLHLFPVALFASPSYSSSPPLSAKLCTPLLAFSSSMLMSPTLCPNRTVPSKPLVVHPTSSSFDTKYPSHRDHGTFLCCREMVQEHWEATFMCSELDKIASEVKRAENCLSTCHAVLEPIFNNFSSLISKDA